MSNILQTIFLDHYEHLIYELHPRTSVIENVNKMIHCGDPSFGGAFFACPDCGELKFVPFRCKSRFCLLAVTNIICNALFICPVSSFAVSIVTVCLLFLKNFALSFSMTVLSSNCLFHSVRDCCSSSRFNKQNKSENFTPGFICVLHTFGRDLKWNPHIHALISEGGAGNSIVWRPMKHFDYTFLRNAFRKVLLERLTNSIGKSFIPVKNKIYKDHADGFYVRAKPNLCTPDVTIKYISRYLGRPVIATSRIDHYDGESVTFHYTRHEDNKTVSECIPALDFIKRLIVHIPEKHFKMLRYYASMPNITSKNRNL